MFRCGVRSNNTTHCENNEYYRTEEEFFHAAGAALRTEYQAIVEAGFLLQIDDPFLTGIFADPALDASGRHKRNILSTRSVNSNSRLRSLRASLGWY